MKRFITIFMIISIVALCGCGKTSVSEAEDATAAAESKKTDSVDMTAKEEKQAEEKSDIAAEKITSGNKSEDVKAYEDESEAESVPLEEALPEYIVSVFEEVKLMYASDPVNVRKGPSTDYERVGGLNRAQEVTVSGRADTGWYEIVYGEDKAYVSGRYLQDDKPADIPAPVPAAGKEGQPAQAVTEVKNVAGVILVGDSRFVQMQANVGENSCTWIAESGKGYNWLNENAIARIDGCVGKGSKIVINLGVNDPGNLNSYLTLINAKAAEWVGKGAKVYYASVNPVWENPYVTEEQVEYFNSQMVSGLSGDVRWIDSHSYLDSIGYKLVDGLHFNAETYQNIYAYLMSCL